MRLAQDEAARHRHRGRPPRGGAEAARAPRRLARDGARASASRRAPAVARRSRADDLLFSQSAACRRCGTSVEELQPRSFSFNSPYGACPGCDGLGTCLEIDPAPASCPIPSLSRRPTGAIAAWGDDRRHLARRHAARPGQAPQVHAEDAVEEAAAGRSRTRSCTAPATIRCTSRTSRSGAAAGSPTASFEGVHPEPRAPLRRDRVARPCAARSPAS